MYGEKKENNINLNKSLYDAIAKENDEKELNIKEIIVKTNIVIF